MKQSRRAGAREARRERWRRVIAAAEASEETIREYCRKQGIHPSHFYYWRRRLAEESEIAASPGGSFVLVDAAAQPMAEHAELELVVERGWRLRIGTGVEESVLRRVLSALAAQS